jgi:hypothetical protein
MRKRKIGLAGKRINGEAVAGGNGLAPAPTRERRRGSKNACSAQAGTGSQGSADKPLFSQVAVRRTSSDRLARGAATRIHGIVDVFGRALSSRSLLPPERHVAIVGHASVLPCVHANEE